MKIVGGSGAITVSEEHDKNTQNSSNVKLEIAS